MASKQISCLHGTNHGRRKTNNVLYAHMNYTKLRQKNITAHVRASIKVRWNFPFTIALCLNMVHVFRCGSTATVWATEVCVTCHILPRKNPCFGWILPNQVLLCAPHASMSSLEGVQTMHESTWPDQNDCLKLIGAYAKSYHLLESKRFPQEQADETQTLPSLPALVSWMIKHIIKPIIPGT